MCAYIADESPKWNGRLVWQAKCPLTLRRVSPISLHRGGVCHFLGLPLPVILLAVAQLSDLCYYVISHPSLFPHQFLKILL